MQATTPVLSYMAQLLPALVVGAVAYLFFRGYLSNEAGHRHHRLKKEAQQHVLPTRLQAYERIALLLERLDPNTLLVRVKPITKNVGDYETLLIKNIEQEYEHNISQQIYVSPACWKLVNAAKNATIHVIRQAAMHEQGNTANGFREYVLRSLMEGATPSQKALAYVKKEVNDLF
ncbi:MAG: hypothetical protein ACPG7E_01220 [Marinirhabdus sp.]